MATIISGAQDTSTILAAEKVVDMDNEIKDLEPELTQFTTALMKYPSREATRERVDWLEDQLFPRLVTLGSATAASSDTSIQVASGDSATLNVNDLLRNQKTGEAMRVTGITADSAIGVTRGVGGVQAASSASGVQLLIVGNAYAQGADTGTSKVVLRTNQYNYTQIFRNSLSFTNTQDKIELYGGRYVVKEQAKKLVEHKRGIEYALFWGARSSTTSSSAAPIGSMGGAFEYISTHVHDQNGATISASQLDQYLIDDLQFCKQPMIFCSPVVAYNFSQFAANAYRTNSTGEQAYNIKVDAFISGAYGTNVPIVVKRDWNDFTVPASGAAAGYGGWAFVVDMARVSLRPLRERSTKLYPNRQSPGQDLQTQEYLTELSFQFEIEKAHAIIKGVSKT